MSNNQHPSHGYLPQQMAHEGRRLILNDEDWLLVKDAIDTVRSGDHDEGSIQILMANNLWDYNRCMPDESEINFLYMRNA